MKNLSEYTNKELTDELAKRRSIPKILPEYEIDIYKLENFLKEYIDGIYHGNFDYEDEHYIYRKVMKTFFGKNIFNWINNFKK